MSGYSLRTAKSIDDLQIQELVESREKPFTEAYRKEMGERLKALRNAKGLSIEKTAELFGASGGTIKAFERGKSMTNDNMIELCRTYGCSIQDFFPDDFLKYCIPNRRTIQKMGSKDLLIFLSLATEELCRRQGLNG